MILTVAFGALVAAVAFGISKPLSPLRLTIAAAVGAFLGFVFAYFNVYPESYRDDAGILGVALLLGGLRPRLGGRRATFIPSGKAGVGGAVLLLLLLTSFVPLTAWGASTIDEPVYIGLQTRATTGNAPSLANASDARVMTWGHASELLARGYSEDASFLDANAYSVQARTYPDFVGGKFLWVHPTAPETSKWLFGGITASKVLYVENNPANVTPQTITGKLAVQLDGAFWPDRVARHAMNAGELRYSLQDVALQLDDSFHPYWIAYLSEIDWRGQPHLEKLLVIDAYTGAEESYTPANAPAWLEQVYPESYVYQWADYWGGQREGLLYRLFNAARLVEPDDVTVRYIRLENTTYWLLPMRQLGSNQLGGYILVNTRTGDARFFDRFDRSLIDYETAYNQLQAIMASGEATKGAGAIRLEVSEGYLYPIQMADGTQRDAYVFPLWERLKVAQFAIIDARDFNTKRVFASSIEDALRTFSGLSLPGTNVTDEATKLLPLLGGAVDGGKAVVNLNGTLYRVTTADLSGGKRHEADREMDELTYAIAEVGRGKDVTLEVRTEGGRVVDVTYPGLSWGT